MDECVFVLFVGDLGFVEGCYEWEFVEEVEFV